MIRLLLGSTLPLLGLAAATAFLGSDLVTGPLGAPIVLGSPGDQQFHLTSGDGEACASALVMPSPTPGIATGPNGTHVLTITMPAHDGEPVAAEDFVERPEAVMLVFDEAGRLIAAGDPLEADLGLWPAADCGETPVPEGHAAI